MSLKQGLIAELQMEAANTRKILERVPVDKNDWKPHAKSMSLGRLATHVAEIPSWVTLALTTHELDFAKEPYSSHVAASNEELLNTLNKNVDEAVKTLENASDEEFDKMWSLRNGETIYFTLPKKVVLRTFAYSHHVHHRAQLGVYLRLLNVPVPGMYGPTYDEMNEKAEATAAAN